MINETTMITCASIIIVCVIIVLMRNYANSTFISKLQQFAVLLADEDVRKTIKDRYGEETLKQCDDWLQSVISGLEDGHITIAEALAIAKTSYPLVKKVLWAVVGAIPVITAYFA